MTKRVEIYDALKNDLLKISAANGFAHDIKHVFPLMKTIDEVNEFPAVAAFMGEENVKSELEDRNLFESALDIILLTHIETMQDTGSEGAFTNEAESWVEDYRKLIASDDPALGCSLYNIEGVRNYYISRVEPYYDRRDNKQTLLMIITVQYIFSI